MIAVILNSGNLGFNHLSFSSQTHSHLPRLVHNICTNKLHSFILTQLDDGSHLELCHHWIQTLSSWIQTPCYLLSDSLENTLTPFWFWLKLIQSDWQTHSFSLNLMMAVIWNSDILNLAILDSDHLSFSSLRFTHTYQHSHFTTDSAQINFTDSVWFNLMMAAHLDFCHLGFSHFAQKKLHSFILTQLDDGSHLELCNLGFSHFAHKELHLFNLTQLDDGSHLEFCHLEFRNCHLGFSHLSYLLSDSLKNTLTPFWLLLKLIQSDSNSFMHKT